MFLSFLTGFTFWMIVGLGSVFFLCVQYVTGGRWGILLRRPLEANARNICTVGFLLFVPVAISMAMGKNSIYWWARAEARARGERGGPAPAEAHDGVARGGQQRPPGRERGRGRRRRPTGSIPPFAIPRGFVYLGIFSLLVLWMRRNAKTAE